MRVEDLAWRQAGIYAIHNSVTGRHYIGSAMSVQRRTRDHLSKLAKGIHENAKMQRSFAKHGAEAFWAEVLELVEDKAQLTAREQFYLDATTPYYNILRTARSGLGFKHTAESKAKMSAARSAVFAAMTPEERKAHVLKKGLTSKGRRHSVETRQKMSETRLGVPKSDAHHAACAAARKR